MGLIINLFTWWIISISWSIAFMIVTGIYLYVNSRAERKEDAQKQSLVKVVKDFRFSWILVSLLIFYIITIYLASATLFAVGNIVVEVILILYVVRNGTNRTKVRARAS